MLCPACGGRLTGRQTSACSGRCRQRLYRARRADRNARQDAELRHLRAVLGAYLARRRTHDAHA